MSAHKRKKEGSSKVGVPRAVVFGVREFRRVSFSVNGLTSGPVKWESGRFAARENADLKQKSDVNTTMTQKLETWGGALFDAIEST